jgi:hypothetical protein
MTYWKASTTTKTRGTPFQLQATDTNEAKGELVRLSTLEIVVLVITFLGFIGQFLNLAYAFIDHSNLKRLTAEVRAIKPV